MTHDTAAARRQSAKLAAVLEQSGPSGMRGGTAPRPPTANEQWEDPSTITPTTCKRCTCPEHEGPNPLSVTGFTRDPRRSSGFASWCKACRHRSYIHYRDQLHNQVLNHYGRACACCGSTDKLTIDHVNGGGNAHRTELFGYSHSLRFYRWLVAQGFPNGYQALCLPCNSSKRTGPTCHLDHAGIGLKYCPCHEHADPNPQPLAEFQKNRSNPDGRQTWCRECRRKTGNGNRRTAS